MKNKTIDLLFLFANVIFFLGLTISVALIIRWSKDYLTVDDNFYVNIPVVNFIAYIVCMVISMVVALAYIVLKNNYLKLVKIHLSKNLINLQYLVFAIQMFVYLLGILFILFMQNMHPRDINNYYGYIVIFVCVFCSLISIGLNSYVGIKIKITLAIRRTKGLKESQDKTDTIDQQSKTKDNNDSDTTIDKQPEFKTKSKDLTV